MRCGLDVCSTSQSIHTKEIPKPMTTPKNSNVRPGVVSMVNIRDAMQAAYQQMTSRERSWAKVHQGCPNLCARPGPQLYLTGPMALPDADRSPHKIRKSWRRTQILGNDQIRDRNLHHRRGSHDLRTRHLIQAPTQSSWRYYGPQRRAGSARRQNRHRGRQ